MTEKEIQLIVMRCLKECTQRITKLEDKGVEQVIVDTIGPMLERLTELEERNIGYKQDIVLLTQENSQMFERITELEEVVNIHDTHSHAITDIVYPRHFSGPIRSMALVDYIRNRGWYSDYDDAYSALLGSSLLVAPHSTEAEHTNQDHGQFRPFNDRQHLNWEKLRSGKVGHDLDDSNDEWLNDEFISHSKGTYPANSGSPTTLERAAVLRFHLIDFDLSGHQLNICV